jgi:phage shock protein C
MTHPSRYDSHGSAPRVTRSTSDRVVAGVLGGVAHHLGWDPFKLRVVYVVLSVLSAAFPGVLVYLLAWFLIPEDRGW